MSACETLYGQLRNHGRHWGDPKIMPRDSDVVPSMEVAAIIEGSREPCA